jgi:DNA-directed RNA polymerase specialized sigma24 family protein
MNDHDEDLALVRRALSGDERAAKIIYSLRPLLVNHLISRGAPPGSISDDAVADFLGDCFGARQRSSRTSTNRLLELYRGSGPLIGWLKTSCWNKFLDGARGHKTSTLSDQFEKERCDNASPATAPAEPEVIHRIAAALEYAFSEIDSTTLIFLRLVYLQGVSQADVAAVFDCDASTVSRRLDQGLTALRQKAEAFQKQQEGNFEVEWPDLLAICQSPPRFIYES